MVGPKLDVCRSLSLNDTIVFQNAGGTDAAVRLIDVSESPAIARGVPPVVNPEDVVVPARRTVSAGRATRSSWETNPGLTSWIAHVDVPDSVMVDSRLELGAIDCPPAPPSDVPALGKTTMPVYRSLAPANAEQRLLGADTASTPADVRVGIFNGGSSEARATIVFYRACDDSVVDTRSVTVRPNVLAEVPYVSRAGCPSPRASALAAPWIGYAIVTVDQPSLTYALSVARGGVAEANVIAPKIVLPQPRARAVRR